MFRISRLCVIVAVITAVLPGCGQIGPLYLPDADKSGEVVPVVSEPVPDAESDKSKSPAIEKDQQP